ncbi:MAG TPA: hydrogenase 3 maturation endopeptidase HyCI [Anaerolineales bacterium]|nr:hydrogenase 3 maturation endopeptidase HyCI [Anaerolineales bacterium]
MEKIKTLPRTWKTSLSLLLNQLAAESGTPERIAIVGIGNQYRCDDAAGILIARSLSQHECVADAHRILILEAGHAPENSTGELRKFAPNLVLLIDAAEMGKAPGTVEWISEEDIDGMSASTHSLPLSMLALYLKMELNCNVILLGIQAASNEVGETVSSEVLQAVNEIVKELEGAILSCMSVGSQA